MNSPTFPSFRFFRNRPSLAILPIMTSLGLLLTMFPVSAADFEWDNVGGGSFHLNTNWDPTTGAPPGSSDTATFNLNNTYQVDFSSSVTNQRLTVSQGNVTFNLNGNAYTADGAGPALRVNPGNGQNATLTVNGGTGGAMSIDIGGAVGTTSGANANLVFDGVEVTIAASAANRFIVGGNGDASVTVQGGSTLTHGDWFEVRTNSATTTVDILVTGADTEFNSNGVFQLGNRFDHAARMIVENGATWNRTTNNGEARIGASGGANQGRGEIIIRDGGTLRNSRINFNFAINNDADGRLLVQQNGLVQNFGSGRMRLNVNAPGNGYALISVDGTNARLENSAAIYVGGTETEGMGPADLIVANGGSINPYLNSRGLIRIWESGRLLVDNGTVDTGDLLFASGGTFEAVLHTGGFGTLVSVQNELTLDDAMFTLGLAPGFIADLNDVFTLFDYNPAQFDDGTFQGLAEGAVISEGGYLFQLSYIDAGDTITLTVIPEPGVAVFLLSALLILAGNRRARSPMS